MRDHDKWFEEHEKSMEQQRLRMEKTAKKFFVVWCVFALIGVGIIGVVVWAMVRFVLKYT